MSGFQEEPTMSAPHSVRLLGEKIFSTAFSSFFSMKFCMLDKMPNKDFSSAGCSLFNKNHNNKNSKATAFVALQGIA